MVKLIYLIRRRSDLSPATFREAALAAQARGAELIQQGLGATDHRIVFEICAKRSHCMASARRLGGQPPDAILELNWPNLEAYDRSIGSPHALRAIDDIIDAERSWVDFARSAAVLVDTEAVAQHSPPASKDELLDEST